MKRYFRLSVFVGTGVLFFANGPSLAQSDGGNAGTISPAKSSTSHSGPAVAPTGEVYSAMPLADDSQFINAEMDAPGSVPDGAAGVSKNSETGNAEDEDTGNAEDEDTGNAEDEDPEGPFAYGISTAPYTTARVAVTRLGNSSTVANTPVTSYPYRPTGKLYFNKQDGRTYICTASLIKKGVLVTAAHCVFNFGNTSQGWYNSFVWCPANTSGSGGVYGCYNAGPQRILTTYYNGSDVCSQRGVVCNDDIATLIVAPKNGVYAGQVVGTFNYSWNGYAFKPSSFLGNVTAVQVTQLGYPRAFDSGYQMERTEAVGWYYSSGNLKNVQIGSAQTGGSSGGPWLANFGTRPTITEPANATLGSHTVQTIIGVTSYGSTTYGYNRQGASFFGQNSQYNGTYGSYGSGNIGLLVRDTCTANPSSC